MPEQTLIWVAAPAAFLAGLLLAWLSMRARVSGAHKEREEAVHTLQNEISDLAKRLAIAENTNRSIPALKADLAGLGERERALQKELRDLSAALAQEKERSSQLKSATEKLALREEEIDGLKALLSERGSEISEIRTRMEEERKRSEEKLALLNDARTELTNQFRVLAQEILDEKGKAFDRHSKDGLKSLLEPFKDGLAEFRKKVDDVYVNEAKERATLKTEIDSLRRLNQQISQEAVNLTRALKGDKKAQGSWGEMILEKVLERSGLRKGIEYETQGAFRDGDGKLFRPDVVVHLPDEKDVVIDSKVSLVAYERYVGAEDDAERAKALAEHVAAVRAHITALSGKDYSTLKGVRSLEFVVLFMPIEAAFVAAFREDESLFSQAFEKRIVVVTPTTLLVTLRTIESIWRYERQNRNAQAIFDRAAAIYEKLRLFLESMEKLGKQINTLHGTYEEAMNRMVRGKGNVVSQLSRFSDLGISVKKELPRTVTDVAEIEGSVEEETPEPGEE